MDVLNFIATGNFPQRVAIGPPYGRQAARFFVNLKPYNKRPIMGVWRQLAEYFYIKKRDPNAPHTRWMRYMHGINRISLFMFIVALIIIFIRMIFVRK
jgi:hypothetical protein